MRLGACAGGIDRYIASVNAGCDYVEFNARQISEYSKEKFDETLALIKEYGVIAEATNCLFPGEIAISSSQWKPDVVDEYTKSLFYKLAQLGVKVSVFGSGGARSIPDGEDPDECMERFYKSIYITAENAKENGIAVALEPLRSAECNILNTVEKAAQICKAVNHSSVGINPDLYHMYNENEPFENLAKYIDYIRHVHIGDYTKRRYPTHNDGCEYSRIFDILKNAGYNGRVSIESGTDDYENDCRQALTILRNAL